MTSETVQAEFEQDLRISGGAPFSACMDMASAVAAQSLHTGTGSVDVRRDVLTLLGLAFYQSGLDLYVRDEGPPRVTMGVHHFMVADAVAVLTDPVRAWDLLELSPGHLAWPDGRIREPWTIFAAELRGEGPSSPRWERLRLDTLAALTAVYTRYTTRLGDLLSLVRHWNTQGWYDSGQYDGAEGDGR